MSSPTIEDLRNFEPDRFEQLVAELMELSGFKGILQEAVDRQKLAR